MTDDNMGSAQQVIPLPTLIMYYVKTRDTLKNADDAHKEKTKDARDMLETLSNLIQAQMPDGLDSVKTVHGTAYKTVKKSATIQDQAEFRRHVIGSEAWELVDWRANAPAVEQFIAANAGELPPGVKYSTFTTIGVRRGKGEED